MVGDSFAKNIILIVIFLALTPVALGTSMFALLTIPSNNPQVLAASNTNVIEYPEVGVSVFASLPNAQPEISSEVILADARVEIITQYLEKYKSPMVPYAGDIVAAADKNGLDFRLITAIAQQESNLCKKIPFETYNCWGWGIHSRGTLGFESFTEGINTVSKGLRENYLDKGYTIPEEIMKKYTPLSNGSWANGVNAFLREMQ